MPDVQQFDLVVIGWGKGGKTLARTLGSQGKRVAMVEQSDQMYGGTCINIGCVPTKALIHQAEERRDTDDPQQWFEHAVEARSALTAKLRAKNYSMLDEVDTVTAITGRGRFRSSTELEVAAGTDRLVLQAKTFVINTGSVPAVPGIDGVEGNPRVFDSTTIQTAPAMPRRLVIVGGGYIGLEFAGMFSHFGSDVTVLESSSSVLGREDDDIAEAVQQSLRDSGVRFITDARVVSIDDDTVNFEVDGQADSIVADAILLAVGRKPATDDLGLDAAGVKVDDRGAIVVDKFLRTTAADIFAVGDVNGGLQFTYISLDDNRIVLDQLTGTGERSLDGRKYVPTTTFVTPPLSQVGMREREAREAGLDIKVAVKKVADIAAMPRPKIVGETHGVMKFVVDARTDQILGATLFSIDSQELINFVSLAMRTGTTATELKDGIYTHPSSTEAFNEVLASYV